MRKLNKDTKYDIIQRNIKTFRNSLNMTFTVILILGGILFKHILFILAAILIGGFTIYTMKKDYDAKVQAEIEYVNRARQLTNKMSGKKATKSKKKRRK